MKRGEGERRKRRKKREQMKLSIDKRFRQSKGCESEKKKILD
jgi:hypothetical protein